MRADFLQSHQSHIDGQTRLGVVSCCFNRVLINVSRSNFTFPKNQYFRNGIDFTGKLNFPEIDRSYCHPFEWVVVRKQGKVRDQSDICDERFYWNRMSRIRPNLCPELFGNSIPFLHMYVWRVCVSVPRNVFSAMSSSITGANV